MSDSQITGFGAFATGVYPVELSAGTRINGGHRIPAQASLDVTTGEVRFFVEQEAVEVLSRDTDGAL